MLENIQTGAYSQICRVTVYLMGPVDDVAVVNMGLTDLARQMNQLQKI
jgi:hypothetical protein